MHTSLAAILGLVFLLISALNSVAQPPDISRWVGFTANTQTQGFNKGDPLKLTWGFAAQGTSINDATFSGFANAPNNLQTRLNGIYGNQAHRAIRKCKLVQSSGTESIVS